MRCPATARFVTTLAMLSLVSISNADVYSSVKTDGHGTYDVSGPAKTRVVAMDADGDGRAEAVAELWGVELLRGHVDGDGDGSRECLLIPGADGASGAAATWFIRGEDGRYRRRLSGEETQRIAAARGIWGKLIERQAAMEFGDVEASEAEPSTVATLLGDADETGPATTLRVVIFHSRAADKSATTSDAGTLAGDAPKPMPMALPPITIRDDAATTARFGDLSMALGPYEESGSARAAAALNVFVFNEAERDEAGAGTGDTKRHVQIGARVTIEGRVDDHFVVLDEDADGTAFAGIPAEDPAGRPDGSWTLEMHWSEP